MLDETVEVERISIKGSFASIVVFASRVDRVVILVTKPIPLTM